jgi:hypothetical protein
MMLIRTNMLLALILLASPIIADAQPGRSRAARGWRSTAVKQEIRWQLANRIGAAYSLSIWGAEAPSRHQTPRTLASNVHYRSKPLTTAQIGQLAQMEAQERKLTRKQRRHLQHELRQARLVAATGESGLALTEGLFVLDRGKKPIKRVRLSLESDSLLYTMAWPKRP